MAPPPRSRPALRPLVSDSAASLDRRRPRGAGGPGAAGADRAPLRPAGALPPRLQDQAGAAPHTRRAAPARPGRVGAGVRDLVGHPGTLSFAKITQPWLRQAVMDWAVEELPNRRGRNATATLQATVNSLELLSASLRLQRDDQGANPTRLGRVDLVAFLNRLAYLHGDGRLSAYLRCRTVREAAKLLRECRELGLPRPGGPLAGLPDDFALHPSDIPRCPTSPRRAGRCRRWCWSSWSPRCPGLSRRLGGCSASRSSS